MNDKKQKFYDENEILQKYSNLFNNENNKLEDELINITIKKPLNKAFLFVIPRFFRDINRNQELVLS